MEEYDPENLRTEYAALVSYYGTVITFRFTTVGFFLAAVGLIVQAGLTRSTSALLLLLTLGAWLVELRNRAIFQALLERAFQIEEDWKYQGRTEFDPLFRRMIRIGLQRDIAQATGKQPAKPFPPDRIKILFWEYRPSEKVVSHSVGLDVIYIGVLAFSVYKVWRLFIG